MLGCQTAATQPIRDCGTFALEDVINAASAIALFQQLEELHPEAERIVVICDHARYYRAKAVNAFLETSRVGSVRISGCEA